jgi:transposase
MISEETVTISTTEYQGMKQQIELLNHQLAELKRMIFGAKRERFIPTDINQGSLFDLPVPEVELESKQEINYTRNKPSSKKQALRLELAPHLPRREEVIEPDNLPQDAIKIGQAVTEILEYEPANIYVRKIVRPKYIASSTDEQTIITIADLPSLPIPKGNAGAGILAHILVSKFVDHLPFYRQVKMFKRQDVNIAESTINGWFNATCNLLSPLYDALKNKLLSANYIMADETPIGVLTKDKPGATHKGYHWVYYDPVKKLVLFDYQKTRSREGPDGMLENYSGYLQTDGYVAYKNLKNQKNITLLACMAHARRKFEHAKDNDPQRAKQALLMFQQLYDIERIAREDQLSYDEIKQLRQKESLPVLNQMENWLKENINQVLPKSAIGGAIAYTLKLWPRLIRYVEKGQFQIDNNLIENSIRPVALGRKNYLFAGSHNAAQQAAIIYSLLATCKINQIEPFSWLKNTLNVIPDYPANQLDKLLPG